MPPGLSHRERLLAGMAQSIREKGFRATTIADVVRLARTSRRTFYEHFEDREACYIALLDQMVGISIAHIEAAIDPTLPWQARVQRAVDANLALATAEPALFRSHVREIGTLGDRGLAVQAVEADRFAELLVRLVEQARDAGADVAPLSVDAALMVVAGMRELMVRACEQDRDLMELRTVAAKTIAAVLVNS